jgi:hypothetical protein
VTDDFIPKKDVFFLHAFSDVVDYERNRVRQKRDGHTSESHHESLASFLRFDHLKEMPG